MARPAIYRPRRPQESALYQCLEHYWEEFQQAYTLFYEKDYGPLRPVVEKTVERFLECGILRHGFARIRCGNCHEEYLLAFSCKTRYFCPSCQAKRVAAFMEWVTEEVLEAVDHRQLVWTIPRVLRPTFRRDRRLLGELARCAWSTLKAYTQARFPDPGVSPGAILAIQTYGDQLNFHPHLHSLLSDGVWDKQGQFHSFGPLDYEVLTRLFQHHVLEMLTHQRRLSREFADRLRGWHPSGFQVYCGPPVDREDQPALERLSAYILRPSFAGTRLQYQADNGQIEYRTTKGLIRRMDALDWIALVTSHIPDRHQQMVRYYGRYSNAARGKRRKQCPSPPGDVDGSSEPDSAAQHFVGQRRRNWARLLKKIYRVDALTCPRCGSRMEIIAFIEEWTVIRKILRHLNLWERPQRAPPPPLLPHKLEAFLATLSPRQQQQVRASTNSVFWDDVPVYRG
jgi:hypothetical protein